MKKFISILSFLFLTLTIKAQEFPIGIFHANQEQRDTGMPTWTTLDEIADIGFTHVQSYWFSSEYDIISSSGLNIYLNTAASETLKVLISLPRTAENNTNSKYDFPGDGRNYISSGDLTRLEDVVGYVKDHSALYGYYLADEPHDTSTASKMWSKSVRPDSLAWAVSELREIDSDTEHPFVITLGDHNDNTWDFRNNTEVLTTNFLENGINYSFSSTYNYDNAADIIFNDTYKFTNEDFANHLETIDDLIDGKSNSQMVLSIHTESESCDGTDKKNDLEEVRFQTYTSLIHKAAGLWYYSYKDAYPCLDSSGNTNRNINYGSVPTHITNNVKPVIRELGLIKAGYLEGETIGSFTWGSVNNNAGIAHEDIHYILKRSSNHGEDGKYLLIAANVSGSTINDGWISLKTLPQGQSFSPLKFITIAQEVSINSGLTALTYNEIDVKDGIIKESFAPWEVKLFELDEDDASIPFEELQATKIKDASGDYYRYKMEDETSGGLLASKWGDKLDETSTSGALTGIWTSNYWKVTAMTHGDYNGDGYDEFVLAYTSADNWQSKVSLYQTQHTPSEIVLYNESASNNGSYYFSSLSSGDTDGDGFDELQATKIKDASGDYYRYKMEDETLVAFWQVNGGISLMRHPHQGH